MEEYIQHGTRQCGDGVGYTLKCAPEAEAAVYGGRSYRLWDDGAASLFVCLRLILSVRVCVPLSLYLSLFSSLWRTRSRINSLSFSRFFSVSFVLALLSLSLSPSYALTNSLS